MLNDLPEHKQEYFAQDGMYVWILSKYNSGTLENPILPVDY